MAADNYGPYDTSGTFPGAWAQADWYAHAPTYAPSGVIGPVASAPANGALGLSFSGLTGTLALGSANVRGSGFDPATAPTFTVAPNTNASLSRRDRVVLRRDLAAKSTTVVQIQGSPASNPTAPSLQRSDSGQWDLPLFSYLVPPNSGTGITGIIDERAWVHLSGSRPVAVYDSDGTKGPMLALSGSGDFPIGGQVFEVSAGRTFRWDGTAFQYMAGPLSWTTLTINGFTPATGNAPRVCLDASGLVHLAGGMINISSYSQPSANFATLPPAYRPSASLRLPMTTSSAAAGYTATLSIDPTSGALAIVHFAGTALAGEGWSLDGIVYSLT